MRTAHRRAQGLERFGLYNLDADPGQTMNLMEGEAERAERMVEVMRAYWVEIQADSSCWDGWTMK
ncbi:MAG: hypothetical protein ACI84D_003216 [Thalassolituus oleivorans]|jgi:hypothetical protein